MDQLMGVVQYILGIGPTAILPIAILIIGLIAGTGITKAFKSGITIGIGFVGINLVCGVLSSTLGPIAQEMVKRFGLSLNVIDSGWPAAAAAAWATPVAAILIPVCLIVNLVMIFFKLTKTLDVDIWNYWHFIAAGATGYIVTDSWMFAIICAILYEVMVLIIADRTAPMVANFYDLEGISLPTGSTAAFGLVGIPIGYLIEKIPGLNKLHADPESIQKRFGIFGEPMMMGLILGCVLAILAGNDPGSIFKAGVSMAAVMFLLPRMVKILMEGLIPISDAMKEKLQAKYAGRELYIGIDAAVSVGHPATMATALILVPITLILAVIIPGNKVLPFGDLATIPFYVAFVVGSRKGNIVHSVITGTIVLAFSLLMATDFATVHTAMMSGASFQVPGGVTQISSLDMGGNFLNWIILKFAQIVGPFFH